MFGTYAHGYGGTYAAVGRPRGSSSGRSVGADLCAGQTAGLTDWPIERIAQTVEPDDAQRAALDELKDATAQALDILKVNFSTAGLTMRTACNMAASRWRIASRRPVGVLGNAVGHDTLRMSSA
jgi:hypothetical protein